MHSLSGRPPDKGFRRSRMDKKMGPLTRQIEIVNDLGLHARSAARIAKIAGEAEAGITIRVGDAIADATSILDILTLACGKGTQVTVRIDNPIDGDILERIVALIRDGFGE